jgi:hypothetical protein
MGAMQIPNRARWVFVLLACLTVSLVCVLYPIYVIRPFRAQGARELVLALHISRVGAWLTVASALAAIGAAIAYWRVQPGGARRILAFVGAVAVCGLAVLARVNVYEQLMFHALDHRELVAASAAKIDPDDKLIAVKVGGVARAYPIRMMGYHHVVNDEVGGTALVATY